MDDLSPDDWRLLLTAVKVAYSAHRKQYQEASAVAADRNITRHYRRMANQDALWMADMMSKLSRLDTKLHLIRSEMIEREAA